MGRIRSGKILAFLFMGMLFLVGCKGVHQDNDETLVTIKFEEMPDTMRIVDGFDNISCVQLEIRDDVVVGEIKRVIIENDVLIVLADNEIFEFNKNDGKFIRRIGSIGEGPEEYLKIEDFYFDPKDKVITTYDRYKNFFVSYGMDGSFKGKKESEISSPWMMAMERSADGTLLICNPVSPHPPFNAFTEIRSDGMVVEHDPFSPIHVDNLVAPWALKPMSSIGSELKYVKMFTDTLFMIKDGNNAPLYKLDFGKKIPSKEIISQLGPFPGSPDYLDFIMKNNYMSGISKIYETSDFIVLIPYQE